MIAKAQEKFDTTGNLTDEVARKLIGKLLHQLVEWTRQLKGGHPKLILTEPGRTFSLG